jgi:hypothetical protein
MRSVIGIFGAAVLFAVFTLLRSRDRGCTGSCVGCARAAGSCDNDGARR